VGPAVEAGVMPKDVAVDMLTSFARVFKLGKQAEDALERWGEQMQQQGQDGQQGQQPQPQDPAMMEAQQKAQAEAQKLQVEQAKLELERSKLELDRLKLELEAQKAAGEAQREEKRFVVEAQQKASELALKRDIAGSELQFKAGEAQAGRNETMRVEQKEDALKTADTDATGRLEQAVEQSTQAASNVVQIADLLRDAVSGVADAAERISKPRKVIRDGRGRIAGLE
jgi:hypothetical protein